ncbi:protein-L-isoaspartate(D-aspartate) O-methyltransferase [Chloroflexota bacterium]
MKDTENFDTEREYMVESQLLSRDIKNLDVLDAMQSVPRHAFVDQEYHRMAYTDGPLPIGLGQTISQPYIVALMTQLLELKGDEVVLEVGTGSGYQAAILAFLAGEVHTIERHPELAQRAKKVIEQLGLENVHIHVGDGTLGLKEFAPYSAIIVTAAAPHAPQAVLDQLDEGGYLVIPVGSRGGQFLEKWCRKDDDFIRENIIPVAFVPLIGKQGWGE